MYMKDMEILKYCYVSNHIRTDKFLLNGLGHDKYNIRYKISWSIPYAERKITWPFCVFMPYFEVRYICFYTDI